MVFNLKWIEMREHQATTAYEVLDDEWLGRNNHGFQSKMNRDERTPIYSSLWRDTEVRKPFR